ncbi:hypothetical protein B0T26DRAFT_685646 [Lasiosphaeria miniovina]|uniref:Secreted protein n=1 Tax=Lasiosphaeria miniovina TaxID=1954250 RepID=A0AA40E9W8_9PEZI|nr:uncharacterized protein B0T26DRAFT_685646 [Lasiosphaeria miniovina]KAK0733759.1 hypothetical protein B0T26DRAFT_685646 [Lasiosphaeria miniovina]
MVTLQSAAVHRSAIALSLLSIFSDFTSTLAVKATQTPTPPSNASIPQRLRPTPPTNPNAYCPYPMP